jgi:uncharacterized surface protein with fasciclin (FAS1) repeats
MRAGNGAAESDECDAAIRGTATVTARIVLPSRQRKGNEMIFGYAATRRAFLSVGALTTLAACGGGTPQVQSQPARTIMEVLASDDSFSRFIEVANRGGIGQTLSGAGPYTLFVFTNSGWGSLPVFAREQLMSGSELTRTQALVNNLIVDGKHTIASLGGQKREFTTRNGSRLTVDATNAERVSVEASGGGGQGIGTATVGLRSARLVRQDIEASNGIIHVLSDIIVP